MVRKKYTRQKGSNPPGKPPIYKTAEELQKKISQYFEDGFRYRKVLVKKGKDYHVEEIPCPTISGLVLYCGFADRNSFYQLEKQEKFQYTIKRAREFISREYEEILQATGNSGAIFALKNFGWTDRQEFVHETKDHYFEKYKDMSIEDLHKRYQELNRN